MSFSNWNPIIKKTKEDFVSQTETITTVQTIFISMATMIGASLLSLLFYWSYERMPTLFISIFAAITFAYAIKVVILITLIRDKLSQTVFKVYLGSGVFMAFMSLMVTVYFAIRTNSRTSSSYSVSENAPS